MEEGASLTLCQIKKSEDSEVNGGRSRNREWSRSRNREMSKSRNREMSRNRNRERSRNASWSWSRSRSCEAIVSFTDELCLHQIHRQGQ